MKLPRYIFSAALGGAALAGLAGCGSYDQKMAHIQTVTVSHAVMFDAGKKELSGSEYEALGTFTHSVPAAAVSYVGLAVDDSNPHALKHARQVKAYLVQQGIEEDTIHVQPVLGSDENNVILTVEYAKAIPPQPCPDWSKNSITDYSNTRFSNFGCAYYNNLTVQLTNPEDFEKGHGQSAYNARDGATIQKYMTSGASSAPAAANSGLSGISGGASSGGASATVTPQ